MSRLFGEKLRYLRQRQGFTQQELAHRLNLASHGHITNLEHNRDVPSLDLVVHAAMVFGVSTDYLLRDAAPIEEITPSIAVAAPEHEAPHHAFGSKLRALRTQANLSQTELAQQLGLARRGYISNLEANRKRPSLDLIVQIADMFGVTTEYLLRNTIPVQEHHGDDV